MEKIVFHCCLCGIAYDNEAAAVKCVNRCGRAMHQKGIFQTQDSTYKGMTVDVEDTFGDTETDKNYLSMIVIPELEGKIPKGVLNGLKQMLKNWDSLGTTGQTQLFDMCMMYFDASRAKG